MESGCCSLLFRYEAGHVEDFCGRELLLHRVELVGTNGVQVTPLQLLGQEIGIIKLLEEHDDAGADGPPREHAELVQNLADRRRRLLWPPR